MSDTNKPVISLLVPIFNVERYLEKCLESARTQTFTDIEVICINDGSTDGSRDIIAGFMEKDSRFKVIDKTNSGYGASMNRGLGMAQGEYIAVLESDDFFTPDALEKLHGNAVAFDAEVVKADFNLYWSTPVESIKAFELVLPEMAGRLVNPQEETYIFYQKPSIWSALYRRDFLMDNEISFLETPGASYQDAGFSFKVWASATRVVFLHEAILFYRQDNEASSVNSPSKVYCVCDEYAEMERYLDERPERKARLSTVLTKMRYDTYMWNYERLSEPLRREFIMRFSEDFKLEEQRGTLDYALFEPWKIDDLKMILSDPMAFHAQCEAGTRKESILRKSLYYLKIGGIPRLTLAVKQRLSQRR